MTRFASCWSAPASGLVLVLVLAAAAPARGDELISTDRPDFTNSSDVVGRGRWQIETSVGAERDSSSGQRVRTVNTPTLLRYGVSDSFELRLDGAGAVHQTSFDPASGASTSERGWAPLGAGFKWHLPNGAGLLFDAGIDGGSGAFRERGLRASLNVPFAVDPGWGDDWSLGLMPGLFVDRNDDGQRYYGGIASASLGHDWGGWHAFTELAAQRIARQRDGGSVLTFDIGGAWRTAAVQLDSALAFGVNRNAPHVALTLGFSIRFD